MKFSEKNHLCRKKFRRLTGMSRRTYYIIVNVISEYEKKKNQPGRPCTLSPEEQVLMTIQKGAGVSDLFSYWRPVGCVRIYGLSNGT